MLSYADIFNHRANLYHQAMTLYPNARDEEFRLLLKLLNAQNTDTILDVPSGGGYLQNRLPKDAKLVSLDPSASFCGYAKADDILNSSISNTPFEDSYFDKFFSLSGLHHLNDKRPFFEEAYRILKAHGILAIADVAVDTRTAFFLNEFIDKVNPQGHTGIFLDNEIIEQLKSCGFRVIHELKKLAWVFENSDEMGHFCKLLFGAECDLATMKRGLNDYMGFNVNDNGKTFLNWELLYIKAIKTQKETQNDK